MVNILLSVLKVIGILLLAVFLLFLFLVLVTLFGPISYRAEGQYGDRKTISAGVNWLGVVLRCKASYSDEQGLLWRIRLFGILIASNDEEFIRKKEEKDKPEETKAEEIMTEEISEEDAATDVSNVEEGIISDEEDIVVPDEEDDAEGIQEQAFTQTPLKSKKNIFNTVKEKTIFIKTKIKNIILKIKAIPEKMKNLIAGIREKVDRVMEIKEFFLGERNREGFLCVIGNAKKMISHILPNKLQGSIEFGIEDPYTMGQILTVLGIFYPVYQDKFTVIPDFEQPGFAGEFSLKGRIIPGYLLFRLLDIICNREVRRIIKEGRRLIGGNKS